MGAIVRASSSEGKRPSGNRTFTPPSPPDYSPSAPGADTHPMEFAARLTFMAAVTCYLLGRLFSGEVAAVETVVYGATAALGLEFVIASWHERWATS